MLPGYKFMAEWTKVELTQTEQKTLVFISAKAATKYRFVVCKNCSSHIIRRRRLSVTDVTNGSGSSTATAVLSGYTQAWTEGAALLQVTRRQQLSNKVPKAAKDCNYLLIARVHKHIWSHGHKSSCALTASLPNLTLLPCLSCRCQDQH